MGKVECLSWPGWRIWFWSQDHREPHFHAEAPGQWEIRVFFGEDPPRYDVQWEVDRIPQKALRKFLRQVADNREQLYREWDDKVKVVDP